MKTLVVIPAYNEAGKIRMTLERHLKERPYDLAIINDGTTDGSLDGLDETFNVKIVSHETTRGVGAAERTMIRYAQARGYEVIVFMAGNDKDRPDEISRLLSPIEADKADFVQGSRYLPGGRFGRMPFYRQLATRFVHPWLFSLLVGRRFTDTTNGFRAISISLLRDQRIDLDQRWLDHYELEPYLFYKAVKLGYKVIEVPVSKTYPPKELGYSKMKPITGWWSILRPLVLLAFGMKK